MPFAVEWTETGGNGHKDQLLCFGGGLRFIKMKSEMG